MKAITAIPFAAALLCLLPYQASAQEAQISDPIAKAPSFTLGDLLPKAVSDAVTDPLAMRPGMVGNTPEQAFQVSIETSMPAHPNVVVMLFVSERPFVTRTIDRVLGWAEGINVPPGIEVDAEFPEEFRCVGDVEQRNISCRFGSAGVQFTGTPIGNMGEIDYSEVKDMLLTLPVEVYRDIFG